MASTSVVKLVPDLNLETKNAATEWNFWREQFEDYMIATGNDMAEDRVTVAILRNMMGPEAAKIVASFQEKTTYKNIMDGIEKYVNPRKSEILHRYEFNKRVQLEGESFEHFLSDTRRLLKDANYVEVKGGEKLVDQILREKIVLKEGNKWVEGIIAYKRPEPRSYGVLRSGKLYRRNTYHLKKSIS